MCFKFKMRIKLILVFMLIVENINLPRTLEKYIFISRGRECDKPGSSTPLVSVQKMSRN